MLLFKNSTPQDKSGSLVFQFLCFKLSPGEELGQTGTEWGAFSCAEQQIAVIWAGNNCSSPSPLSQQESKVQQGTKPGRACNLWLVWRRESCVLVHSNTDKICTQFFLKRIWDENLYYIHKQYSDFFEIRNLSKVDLCGQSWRNGRKHLAWDICALVPLFYLSPLFLV